MVYEPERIFEYIPYKNLSGFKKQLVRTNETIIVNF